MYALVLQDKVPQARELVQVSMSCNVLGVRVTGISTGIYVM